VKRITEKFKELSIQQKCAFIGYICAGDPTYEISLEVLKALPKAGCDIIELGIPFLDPAGDGPTIENAAKRAISGGMDLKKVLKMAENFRKTDEKTPVILMTYYNPLLKYGLNKIFFDADKSGVDGFLIVDLPLEEEPEIKEYISQTNLDLIGLIAPTTNQERAAKIAKNHSGFLYLISMLGITGTKSADISENQENLKNLREVSTLPIAIGFGIQTPKQAGEFSKIGADGVVVGSTIVKEINENFLAKKSTAEIVEAVVKKVQEFSKEIQTAR
jgi:tryptophan synthase alpha chain